MTRGVVYVAYGKPAQREALASVKSLRAFHDWPVMIVSDRLLPGTEHVYCPPADPGARAIKLELMELSPFDETLYLDADTRVRGSLDAGFAILGDGWDMAIAPSTRQGSDVLGNVTEADRRYTLTSLAPLVLGLQAGVMFLRKCEAVERLFAAWQAEWKRFKAMDQGAFLRAMWEHPVRLWILGRAWNGGELVEHRFGAARQ